VDQLAYIDFVNVSQETLRSWLIAKTSLALIAVLVEEFSVRTYPQLSFCASKSYGITFVNVP